MAESYAEKEAKMINGVTDVFVDNEANVFEAYRVLMLMLEVVRLMVMDAITQLGDEAERAKAALDDFIGGMEEDVSE